MHHSLFLESSPGPVKYAAFLLGLCESETRLPLVEIDENIKQTQYEVDSNDKIISSSIKVVPYKTSITKEIIKKDFLELNKIWSKANIKFNLRDINFTKAETKNFRNYEELSFKNYNNINYIVYEENIASC